MNQEPLPLFGPVETTKVQAPKNRPAGDGRPKWTPVKSTRPQRCDHCVSRLHESNGNAPMAMTARMRRRTETTDELLCYAHANIQRGNDGLPEYRGKRR